MTESEPQAAAPKPKHRCYQYSLRMPLLVLLASVLAIGFLRWYLYHPSPTTKEEFVSMFTKAYESGDKETIAGWMKWGDIPEELRPRYLAFCTAFAGENKVVAMTCVDYDPRFIQEQVDKGERLHFSLTPVFWFAVETSGHAGFEGGETSSKVEGALGVEGGHLYFCGPMMDFDPWRKSHGSEQHGAVGAGSRQGGRDVGESPAKGKVGEVSGTQ